MNINRTLQTIVLDLSLLISACSASNNNYQIMSKQYEQLKNCVMGARIELHGENVCVMKRVVDDEDYILTVQRIENNEFILKTIYVAKKVYDSLEVGQSVDLSRIVHETIDPYDN